MARDQRPLQRNAADPRQIKYAERKAKQQADRRRDAIAAILRTPAGRTFLWTELQRLGVYRSIWDPSAKIHYNAGRQDAGHELLADLVEADEEAYLLMEREMRAFAKAQDREIAAVHTPAAAEGESTDGN